MESPQSEVIFTFTRTHPNGIQSHFFNDWVDFISQQPDTVRVRIATSVPIQSITVSIGFNPTENAVRLRAMKRLFETEHAAQITSLSLVNCYFKDIPHEIQRLTSLENFEMYTRYIQTEAESPDWGTDISNGLVQLQHNTAITTFHIEDHYLPTINEIGAFSLLEKFNILHSQLTHLSESFYSLQHLTIIYIESCQLDAFSSRIWELPVLRDLVLDDNPPLSLIPDVLVSNETLELFSCKNCHRIQTLPESFVNLKSLIYLELVDCGIQYFSGDVLSYLEERFLENDDRRAMDLYLNGNPILRLTSYTDSDTREFVETYLDACRMDGRIERARDDWEEEDADEDTPRPRPRTHNGLTPLMQPNTPVTPTPPTPQNVLRFMCQAQSQEDSNILDHLFVSINQLNIQNPENTIDGSQMGYYAIQNENIPITEFLRRSIENMVIRYKDSYYLTTQSDIHRLYLDCIFYKCHQAGDNAIQYMDDSNIDTRAPLFDLKKIGIPIQYVYQINVDLLLFYTATQYYIIQDYLDDQTGLQQILASTISKPVYDGITDSISANHCGTNQGGVVYAILPTILFSMPAPDPAPDSSIAPAPQESGSDFQATVLAKGNPQTYPVTERTTVGELVSMVASQNAVQENQVRLLFSGRILSNPNQIIQDIPGYEKGLSTFLLSLRPLTGGNITRRHKHNKIKRRKTIKYAI